MGCVPFFFLMDSFSRGFKDCGLQQSLTDELVVDDFEYTLILIDQPKQRNMKKRRPLPEQNTVGFEITQHKQVGTSH